MASAGIAAQAAHPPPPPFPALVVPLAFPLRARRPPGGAIAFGCQRFGGGVADVRHLILFCRRGCGGAVGKWQRQCQCPPRDVFPPPDHSRSRHIIPGSPVIAM
jgi:hypothetical protein